MKIAVPLMMVCLLFPASGATKQPCPSLDTVTINECGGLPFVAAADMEPGCAVAAHLIPFAAYLREKNRPCSSLVADFYNRYLTFTDTLTCKIDTRNVRWIGSSGAPVSLIMYVSMSCPYCKQVYAHLYDSLNAGTGLDTLLRVGIKHLTTSRFDRMLAAAAVLGKQPAFLRTFARISERASDDVVRRIADSTGIRFDSLRLLADSPRVTGLVTDSRTEALRNKVETTPTLFINNRRYRSYKDARWVIDAARWELKRKKRK